MDGRVGVAAPQLCDDDVPKTVLAFQDRAPRDGSRRGHRRDHCWAQPAGVRRERRYRHDSTGPERPMTSTNLFRVSASMNRLRLFVCCVVAAGLGCKKDATFTEPIPNYAHITWLNAVSDTMQLDLRVIDIPTNASFEDADFRSAQFFPINIEPGARHVRVFLSSSIDSIAKKVVLDTTYTFVDGEPYSFYVTGRARAGSAQPVRALITNLNVGTPGPGQFALRIVNLAP